MVKERIAPARRLRCERQLTLAHVADAIGVDISWLSRVERGEIVNPSYDLATRLARFYGVSPDSLFPSGKSKSRQAA